MARNLEYILMKCVSVKSHAQQQRKLLDDDQEPNRTQHSLNDGRGKHRAQPSQLELRQNHLRTARNKNGNQQYRISRANVVMAEHNHRSEKNRRQAGSRTADRYIGSAEKRQDEARDDRRYNADDGVRVAIAAVAA